MSDRAKDLRIGNAGALVLAILNLAGPPAWGTEIPAADRRSGYDFMSPETRAMQDDDKSNPGMLWVLDGARRRRSAPPVRPSPRASQ